MSTIQSIKDQLQYLLTCSNDKTGVNDTSIVDAVNTLKNGYRTEACPGGLHINKNLSNVSVSESYSGTVSPPAGFTVSSLSVKMGDNNITASSYSDGQINISEVTDNIYISSQLQANTAVTYGSGCNTAMIGFFGGYTDCLGVWTIANDANVRYGGYYPMQIPAGTSKVKVHITDTMGHGANVSYIGYIMANYNVDSDKWTNVLSKSDLRPVSVYDENRVLIDKYFDISVDPSSYTYMFINVNFDADIPSNYDASQISIIFS